MMIKLSTRSASDLFLQIVVLGFVLISMTTTTTTTTNALKANSWQKRLDRAFLQVDGITPEGRFRSIQRAFKDPELKTDITKAINVVREKGFGKGHPEFIELIWPEGTQARRDLEAINALSKQLPERISEFDNKNNDDNDVNSDSSGSGSSALFDLIRSTQEQVRFGDKNGNADGARAVTSSLVERVKSDPDRSLRLAKNFLRNTPVDVESPTYELLGKYSDDGEEEEEGTDDENGNTEKKKSFLTVAPLELRRYDAFQTVSVPLLASSSSSSSSSSYVDETSRYTLRRYTLQNMGTALTEIFSYLELGDNTESTLMSMTTPFFISDTAAFEDTNKMFVKLPFEYEVNPPNPVESSRIELVEFPETVVATLSFAGIITEDEIKRQKFKLIERIETAGDIGWKIKTKGIDSNINNDETKKTDEEEEEMIMKNDEEDGEEFMFLQYNAPGTLPWRRMNEIAVVMEKISEVDDNNENEAKDDIIEIDQVDPEVFAFDEEEEKVNESHDGAVLMEKMSKVDDNNENEAKDEITEIDQVDSKVSASDEEEEKVDESRDDDVVMEKISKMDDNNENETKDDTIEIDQGDSEVSASDEEEEKADESHDDGEKNDSSASATE